MISEQDQTRFLFRILTDFDVKLYLQQMADEYRDRILQGMYQDCAGRF